MKNSDATKNLLGQFLDKAIELSKKPDAADHQEAIKVCNVAIGIATENKQDTGLFYSLKIKMLDRLGETQETLKTCEAYVSNDSNCNNPAVFIRQGAILAELGNRDESLKAFDQAIKIGGPTLLHSYITKAHIISRMNMSSSLSSLELRDSYNEALKCYGLALKLRDQSKKLPIYLGIAVIYAEMHEYQNAKNFYSKAISADSTQLQSYIEKAIVCLQLKEYVEVIQLFDEAEKKGHSLTEELYMYKGSAHVNIGEYKKASECYTKVIKLDSNHYDAHIQYASCLFDLNDYTKALEYYTKGQKIDPEQPRAYLFAGIALSKMTLYEQALEKLNIAINMLPDSYLCYKHRGDVFYALGSFQEALESYNQAIKHCDKTNLAINAQLLMTKGVCQSALGDKIGSFSSYLAGLKINPNLLDEVHNNEKFFINDAEGSSSNDKQKSEAVNKEVKIVQQEEEKEETKTQYKQINKKQEKAIEQKKLVQKTFSQKSQENPQKHYEIKEILREKENPVTIEVTLPEGPCKGSYVLGKNLYHKKSHSSDQISYFAISQAKFDNLEKVHQIAATNSLTNKGIKPIGGTGGYQLKIGGYDDRLITTTEYLLNIDGVKRQFFIFDKLISKHENKTNLKNTLKITTDKFEGEVKILSENANSSNEQKHYNLKYIEENVEIREWFNAFQELDITGSIDHFDA